ncbi:MAG TPA: hypothetical protein VG714_10120 [Acidobacteriaceae bacterium]|nr:hypothetical protein [Acidobacteriaceae bacterium]
MPRTKKSPQEKKQLAYDRDHYSSGESDKARRSWGRKKANANRQYRRKSDELFAEIKPGMDASNASEIAEELTVAHVQKSLTRKRLQKWSAVTLRETVSRSLTHREERAGRRARSKQRKYDAVSSALDVMTSLRAEELTKFVRRYALISRGSDPIGYQKMAGSKKELDRALCFLYEWQFRGVHRDVICANKKMKETLAHWAVKANRILARDRRAAETKQAEKESTGRKVNALRRATASAD